MKRIIILSLAGLAFIGLVSLKAGYPINGGPVAVTCPTNSALGAASPPVYLTFPSTTVIISGITNEYTQTTNSFCMTLTNGPTSYVLSVTSVFNAASNGVVGASIATPQSWTNTYPTVQVQVPLSGFLQTAPQSGGSNTFSVTSQ
jgi:hypothetical protein